MNRLVPLVAVVLVALPLVLMVLAGGVSSPVATTTVAGAPTALALDSIPPQYLTWYMNAAQTCPGLPWAVLAGIGTVESGNGQSDAPGVHSGANFAGAEGPMQLEPATFAAYAVHADPDAPLTPYNAEDAIYTAAAMLCADGASGGTQAGIRQAIYAYNHATWYVNEVLAWAAKYAAPAQAGGIAQAAISYAEDQLGKPYLWGADGPDAFDCSGLVYAAYKSAGIVIGRTTYQWRQDGTVVPLDQIEPGDLLFYAGSDGTATNPGHVVIYIAAARSFRPHRAASSCRPTRSTCPESSSRPAPPASQVTSKEEEPSHENAHDHPAAWRPAVGGPADRRRGPRPGPHQGLRAGQAR